MRLSLPLFAVCLFLFTRELVLGQGALTRPGGMIAPTMKTLDQVEARTPIPGGASLFTISSPGSYYLTGNRSGPIVVAADFVTIDLNGFRVEPPFASDTAIELSSRRQVVIRNGQASKIMGTSSAYCAVEDVHARFGIFFLGSNANTVRRCGLSSIEVGENSVVEDCVVEAAEGIGIVVGSHSMVRRCRVRNARFGVVASARSIVTECVISGGNAGGGAAFGIEASAEGVSISKTQVLRNGLGGGVPFVGINLGPYGSVSECMIVGNTGSGIETSAGTSVSITNSTISENSQYGILGSNEMLIANCRVTSNGLTGIAAGSNAVVQNCVVSGNGAHGIEVADGSSIVDSVAAGHSNGSGFLLGGVSRGSIRNCLARGNSVGINGVNDSFISNCTAMDNVLQGIRVQSNCRVLENHLTGNGDGTVDAAGLLVTGSLNRIEGNSMGYNNARGLKVSGGNNFIVRNTVGSGGPTSTHYDIVAGNRVAPIVAATANGAAISGGSAATSLGSTDPAANYSY